MGEEPTDCCSLIREALNEVAVGAGQPSSVHQCLLVTLEGGFDVGEDGQEQSQRTIHTEDGLMLRKSHHNN